VESRDLTEAGLTEVLRQAGSLPRGSVLSVHLDRREHTWVSELAFVEVAYSADAPPDLPRALVVKWPRIGPDEAAPVNRAEVEFYARVGQSLPVPPRVRCLAALDGQPGGGLLVLEDLRNGYDHPPWPIPPSRRQCEAAMAALAHLHAQWWDHTSLGNTIGTYHTVAGLQRMVAGIAAHLPAFFTAVGDALPTSARSIIERVFGSPLRPWLRIADRRALTVIHGDAHTWNFLFPRSGVGSVYLLDWHLWHLDVGARDVAFLIGLHWSASRRRELELDLLRYYHGQLVQRGVQDYPFEELLLDYRRCLVRNLTFPIILWARGMKPEGWWDRLDHAVTAYQDHDCDALL
jgi:hypothetical protein